MVFLHFKLHRTTCAKDQCTTFSMGKVDSIALTMIGLLLCTSTIFIYITLVASFTQSCYSLPLSIGDRKFKLRNRFTPPP